MITLIGTETGQTVASPEDAGGSRTLVAALRRAMGEREGIEIRWVRA